MENMTAKFMSRVTKADNGCWIWVGAQNCDGYGHLRYMGKSIAAHRFSYMWFTGNEIPPKMCICHKCDCPPCVNPDHLFLGTYSDNMQDKIAKGRHYSGYRSFEERSQTMREAWTRYPEERRQEIATKIAAAKTGVPLGAEHLASIRAARAKPRSAEYRQKLGAAHKGVPSWNKGIPMREETKQKLSQVKTGIPAWNKGLKTPAEVREKQAAAKRGRTLSPETRMKMSAAQKKRYQ